jgi:2-succinyl-5-enolpyruvyl-6-hydroxy-3-cyclohexene-1-carboxylate synthase
MNTIIITPAQSQGIIYQRVLEEVIKVGVTEFCVCPGSRNSPLINCLVKSPALKVYYWYEERSAAFFALGRARITGRPVAIVTTSGTAAGELLPAAMEAHYTGTPILLITADRPRRFRGTGAPQSAEQEGIFGVYAHFAQDLESDEPCLIQEWDLSGPAHLNVCLEDPKSYRDVYCDLSPLISESFIPICVPEATDGHILTQFFERSCRPLVIVSTLKKKDKLSVLEFLLKLEAPIYCESGSGLREEPRLQHLQTKVESSVWKLSKANQYEIDGILRIGGVPITRLWRDLEEREGRLAQCSLSDLPFSGLSWGSHLECDLSAIIPAFQLPKGWRCTNFSRWYSADENMEQEILKLFERFPTSEPALFQALSKQIPSHSMVYLGNSLPVREWDLAALRRSKGTTIETSRGVNGIDGQLSTFLGLCNGDRENWAILGDLTALYDFPALWILADLPDIPIKVVVMNNGGGKIFARIYKDPIFQHLHNFDFEHFAKSWKIPYFCWSGIISNETLPMQAFVEVCPDPEATDAFWRAYDALS